ncbi:hypothetical protein M1D58_09735 [Pseudomonas sp. R4-76]|uniref:hypothetical protein n=1 Tax=unclassified Pseudomonas TaxID=196821 RepID=UPI003DA8B524
MMRNIQTREGYEFWDKICAVQSYAFLLSPDGRRVVKTPDIGDWIDKHEAQVIVDHAQEEFNVMKAERDALQQRLNAADQRIDELEQDKARLDALDSNCWDVRFNSSPNGDAGDSSFNIEVVGHWMDKPFERVIGENYNEDLRAAIDQAMKAPAYPPARPEYPEPESGMDDDWHMNPCKQGHRDVGAAGGVAACNQCDEKIEAATTQEAFERWNASHPVPQE